MFLLSKLNEEIKRITKVWGHNTKVLVFTEAFWSIPMSWVLFYRPIFLNSIGLSDIEIGFVYTLLSFYSIILPFFGSFLADILGKKRAFMICDSTGWLLALATWFFAKNFIHVLIAITFEGIIYATAPIWETLLVEDTLPEFRISAYGSVSAFYIIGSLSVPIAGLLINAYGVEGGNRILFIIAFISLFLMFTLRWIFLEEGRRIKNSSNRIELEKKTERYKSAIKAIISNKNLLVVFLVSVLGGFYYTLGSVFVPLFLVDERGLYLSPGFASIVPLITSILSIFLLYLYISRIKNEHDYLIALFLAYSFSTLASLILIFAVKNALPIALIYAVLSSFYSSSSFSVSRTFLNNEIEKVGDDLRVNILSLVYTSTSMINIIAPTLLGYTYSVNPRITFLLVAMVMGFCSYLLLKLKTHKL